ncbi:hypothetical protein Tsubulata_028198, partial [Turnera subulata]
EVHHLVASWRNPARQDLLNTEPAGSRSRRLHLSLYCPNPKEAMASFLHGLFSKFASNMEGHKELDAEKRKVVVVGGGLAGSLLAKSLQFNADVTLIDPKEYLEITWADLRAMVEPSVGKRSVINHREYFSNGRIITSTATNITETDTVNKLPMTILSLPLATAILSQNLKQRGSVNSKLNVKRSRGPTGVELAGEIAVDFPEKEVTLVHNGSRLLEFVGPKAADKSLAWLKSKRVQVKLEQKVDLEAITDSNGTKTYHTSAGENINADCHFLCIGKPLSSAWLKDTFLKSDLDTQGRLMVDEHLRVKGRKNIFAIGDITDIPEIKQGYLAQKHASVAAKNLKLLMAGGKEEKMATYKPAGKAIAIVSLGRCEAVAQFPFTTISGYIPGMIKSRDLFIGKTRKTMGLPSHLEDN